MPVIASALMGLLLFSGAAVSAAGAATPAAPALPPGFSATMTGYNAVPEQTKPDPSTTANGGPSTPGVVAARSQDLGDELPFGTVIAIAPAATSSTCGYDAVAPLIGYRVVTDTMNARYHDRVDLLFDTHALIALAGGRVVNAAVALGVCPVTVSIVGYIDLTKHALPASQAALAALIGESDLALN